MKTREDFIKKYCGVITEYTSEGRDLMREDLDKVIEWHTQFTNKETPIHQSSSVVTDEEIEQRANSFSNPFALELSPQLVKALQQGFIEGFKSAILHGSVGVGYSLESIHKAIEFGRSQMIDRIGIVDINESANNFISTLPKQEKVLELPNEDEDIDGWITKQLTHIHDTVRGMQFDLGFRTGALEMYMKQSNKVGAVEAIELPRKCIDGWGNPFYCNHNDKCKECIK